MRPPPTPSDLALRGFVEPADRDDEVEQLAEAIRRSLRITVDELAAAERPPTTGAQDAPAAADAAAADAGPEEEPVPDPDLGGLFLGVQWPQLLAADQPFPEATGEVRFYTVWRFSGNAVPAPGRLLGIHASVGASAYAGLIALNGGHFGGLRFRRLPSLAEARRRFASEAPSFNLPIDARLYWWEDRSRLEERGRGAVEWYR